MKRYYSESDSEGDAKSYTSSNNDPQAQARKKRRGVIEKRRRDRINNSLSELRRLVPSASEKQGCSKLEKAEILQLTVEHLKTLHENSMYHPAAGLDSRATGFRECAAEVVRYLVTVEGMAAHEPLTQRLLSHLHTSLTQREKSEEYNFQLRSLQQMSAFPSLLSTPVVGDPGHPPPAIHGVHNPRRPHEAFRPIPGQPPLAALTAAFPFFSHTPFPVFSGIINSRRPYDLMTNHSVQQAISTGLKAPKQV